MSLLSRFAGKSGREAPGIARTCSTALVKQPVCLLRQMKCPNDARCPQDMASYRAHDITEFEALSADIGYIGGIE